MYCPNCEFEIKQEVTECPICGGELTQYPPEGADANTGSDGSEEKNTDANKPLDTCISDLILDAKHELDSLDATPDNALQPVEPFSSSLDFESMLSEDSTETAQPTAEPFTAEPPVPSAMPDTPQTNEEPFLLNDTASPFIPESDAPMVNKSPIGQNNQPETLFSDDALFINEATSPTTTTDTNSFIPETDAPAINESPIEQNQQTESIFSDDKLFIDETTAPTNTPNTGPFIDESRGEQPESPLESAIAPPGEQSFEQPWSLQELSTREPTETINFIPEEQAQQPDAAPTNGIDFLDIEEAGSSESAENQSAGSRSKKRLIFILLFGVLLIAGAYTLQDYVVQLFESKQIKKPTPTRIIPKAAVKKPRTPAQPELQQPAANLQEETVPAKVLPEDTQQQASAPQPELQAPSANLPSEETQQQEPSTPEEIRTEKAIKKPVQKQTIAPKVKPEETIDKPIQSSGVPSITPEKKQSPAKSNYYTIHVASFKAQQIAGEEVERFRKLGFDAYIETVDLGAKGVWHRVKVGHYATRADAEQTVRSIRQKKPGVKPLIYKNK